MNEKTSRYLILKLTQTNSTIVLDIKSQLNIVKSINVFNDSHSDSTKLAFQLTHLSTLSQNSNINSF